MDPRYAYYAGWVANHGNRPRHRVFAQPRRAVVEARTYRRGTVRAELLVAVTAPGRARVRQDLRGRAPVEAWIPAAQALPA